MLDAAMGDTMVIAPERYVWVCVLLLSNFMTSRGFVNCLFIKLHFILLIDRLLPLNYGSDFYVDVFFSFFYDIFFLVFFSISFLCYRCYTPAVFLFLLSNSIYPNIFQLMPFPIVRVCDLTFNK